MRDRIANYEMRDRIANYVLLAGWGILLLVWLPMIGYVVYLAHTRGMLDDATMKWIGVSIPFAFGPLLVMKVAVEFLDGGLYNHSR